MIQDLIENVKLTPQEQNIVNYIDHHPKEDFLDILIFSLPLFKNKIWQLKQNIKELQRIVM